MLSRSLINSYRSYFPIVSNVRLQTPFYSQLQKNVSYFNFRNFSSYQKLDEKKITEIKIKELEKESEEEFGAGMSCIKAGIGVIAVTDFFFSPIFIECGMGAWSLLIGAINPMALYYFGSACNSFGLSSKIKQQIHELKMDKNTKVVANPKEIPPSEQSSSSSDGLDLHLAYHLYFSSPPEESKENKNAPKKEYSACSIMTDASLTEHVDPNNNLLRRLTSDISKEEYMDSNNSLLRRLTSDISKEEYMDPNNSLLRRLISDMSKEEYMDPNNNLLRRLTSDMSKKEYEEYNDMPKEEYNHIDYSSGGDSGGD